jgi:2-polyprenyl-6-methoxyphenol hydroxylase-like FAD-dependent oxidoreductase
MDVEPSILQPHRQSVDVESVFSSPTDSRISPPALQNACSSDYTALATDERAVHRGKVGLLDSRQNSASAPASTVLIVGSGPAGLFAACELLRHGVKPRVVERRLAPHGETRGTALQPAVLEILDRAGLIEPFLRASVHIRRIRLLGPGLREIGNASLAGIGCAYEFQCSLPQWRTEAILRDHLERLGLEIEFGTDVTSIEDDPAGLRVTLDTGGRTEVVTAAYVLGAGGGHSVTRHSMQEHLAGETYGGRYLVADLKLNLPCPPECGRVIVGPTGFVLVSPLPDDRWLIFVNRDEADARSELPTAAELGAMLDARIGVDVGLSDLRWISYFKMHNRAVVRLSDGRRFLLGDAGHLSSPLGGEGVNSALMDAADIAWKLALVVRGAAKPSLLDSYAAERGAADHHVLEVSDEIHRFVTDLVAMCDGGGAPTLPQGDPARDLAAVRRRSMLDVSYAGSALVGQAGAVVEGPSAGDRFPARCRLSGTCHHLIVFGEAPRLHYFRARWDKLVSIVDAASAHFDATEAGVPNGGAVLVRPDGFIGFRAAPADETAMAALDAHLTTYLVPSR